MNTLKQLEKKRYIWFLIGICTAFFLLRLPSLIEPYWYGDEGIYQVISLAMQNGRELYADAWDNKPPLLYVTYALFGGDQFAVRFLSLFFGIGAVIVFFILARSLLNSDKAAGASAIAFTLLFATPYLEGNIANAENFMLLFVITAGLIVYKNVSEEQIKKIALQKPFFIAGLLLGTAFLFKIVAFFDFAAFCLFLILATLPNSSILNRQSFAKKVLTIISHAFRTVFSILIGFLLPILLAFLYFTLKGNLMPFIQSAFFGNIGYVGYGNYFLIPQGLLILKLILFITVILLLSIYRKSFSKPVLFITIWFVFTIFSAFFSQRPYTHYLLVLLPSVCLLIGLLFTKQSLIIRIRSGVALALMLVIAVNYFHVYGIQKTMKYYQNAITFLAGQKSVYDYQTFFDSDTPRDYELVSYINAHTTESDQIFVWGDSAQIYYMTKKLPLNKYTVSYHILADKNGVADTQAAIDKIQPKFIITLSEAPPLPLELPQYVGKHSIKGSAIYERTN